MNKFNRIFLNSVACLCVFSKNGDIQVGRNAILSGRCKQNIHMTRQNKRPLNVTRNEEKKSKRTGLVGSL